ncbi:MAG: hypothetical protein DHS20C07_10910 [Methyloligella sp.]|nr:MAG: hypothetical protein DHS20C07_10910 [Methyloligella sp.]
MEQNIITPAEIVNKWYETRDPELFHEDILFHVCSTYPLSGVYKGRREVYDNFFAKLIPMFESFSLERDVGLSEGEKVVIIGRYIAKLSPTSEILEIPFTHLWTVHKNLITSIKQHAETGILDRAFLKAV